MTKRTKSFLRIFTTWCVLSILFTRNESQLFVFKEKRAEDGDTTESTAPSINFSWWRGNNSEVLALRNISHPHLGAIHPNGTIGMIVDPSPLRIRRFDPKQNNDDIIQRKVLCPAATNNISDSNTNETLPTGIEGEGGYEVLQKIKTGAVKSREFLKMQQKAIDEVVSLRNYTRSARTTNMTLTVPIGTIGNTTARAKRSKILCMVYSAHFPPTYDNPNVRAVAQTWGRQCDGFFVASNFTDHATGSINLSHMGLEKYGNMWQKVRSMWAYAHDHYREEFDFFHIGGDDMYVVVDNLRAYLDGPEVTRLENGHCDHFYRKCAWTPEKGPRPLYFGAPLSHKNGVVPAGGPGYTLNRAALDILVEEMLPTFLPFNEDPREDVLTGSALGYAGILLSRSEDASGGSRYGGSAANMFRFRGVSPTGIRGIVKKYGLPPLKLGINSTSEQFIAGHLKDDLGPLKEEGHTVAELMYRYHAIFNDHWCNSTIFCP